MISAIIITRNEDANIKRTIDSLSDSRITEIIIVDSNSSDSTTSIVKSIKDKRIKLIVYDTPPFTAARGRHEGAKIISRKNKYILFLDGDMEYFLEFTDDAVNELEKDNLLAGIEGERVDIFYKNGKKIGIEPFQYKKSEYNPGGALFVRTEEYFKTPGFKKELICGEEGYLYSYIKKNNRYFKRINAPMFYHHTEMKYSKKHILIRFSDKRFLCLGKTFFYSLDNFYILKDFIYRNRYILLASFCWLLLPLLIYTWPIIVVIAALFFYKFRTNKKIILSHAVSSLGLIVGFIFEIVTRLFRV